MLLVTPWSDLWDRNYFAASLPLVAALIHNDYVRGAVTGIGLLTVLAGLAELGTVLAGRREVDEPAPPQ